MRKHFPSTGRVARWADAFASWRAAVITFQLLARRRLKREIVKMCWHVLTRFPKAREKNLTLYEKSVARPLKRAYSAGWR